jgi:hypothetical protein
VRGFFFVESGSEECRLDTPGRASNRRKKDQPGRLELPDLSFVNGKSATAQDLLEF